MRSWAGLGFCHPYHNLLLMTVVVCCNFCFTVWSVVPKGFCSISALSSPSLDSPQWGLCPHILDPSTAVDCCDFLLSDKLTVTVFSVLLVQLLSSAGSVQLGLLRLFYSVLASPPHACLPLPCVYGGSRTGGHFLTFPGRSRSQLCNSLDPELNKVSCSSIRNRVFFLVLFT